MTRDEAVSAVARRLRNGPHSGMETPTLENALLDLWLIAMEQAAQIADEEATRWYNHAASATGGEGPVLACSELAARFRAEGGKRP